MISDATASEFPSAKSWEQHHKTSFNKADPWELQVTRRTVPMWIWYRDHRKDDRQRPVIPWDWKRSHPSGQTSSHLFGLQLASSVYRKDGYTLRGTEIMKKILLYLIRFYRKYLSPMKVYTHCIYIPTCSEYALEAIEKYGAFKGGLLTVWRILRCNPFAKGGYDPVP